jgi:nucleoside-diphosphate-sugar epimerase
LFSQKIQDKGRVLHRFIQALTATGNFMVKQPSGHLFCFGLGYTAGVLARRLLAAGWTVTGTARSEAGKQELEKAGIEAHIFTREQPLENAGERLAGVTHILSSISSDLEGDPVIDLHGSDLTAASNLEWAGYLSSTGVYGDRGGDWVDESSERTPTTLTGRRRVAAEDCWLALGQEPGGRQSALPVHLFRLAGIYGPGRNAVEAVREGRARRIHKAGQVFSRIHVDDIATVLIASMERPNPGAVYNLCDDRVAPQEEVVAFAARLLGQTPPPLVDYEEANLPELARAFYSECKRVSNRRIKTELGVVLRYPDYEAGLRALYEEITK